jgi:hypothetical protein
MDTFAFSSLINLGRVQTVGDDIEEVCPRSKFSYKTLELSLHVEKFTGIARRGCQTD